MATYKATSKKKDSGSNVFKATERKSYDSSYINKWEEEEKEARSILDDYITRRNKNDWFSEDEVSTYKSALDKYKSSSKSLTEIRKNFGEFSEEEEKGFDDYISNLSSDLDTVHNLSSTFKTRDDYNKWVSDNEEYEKKKSYDLEAAQKEIEKLEAEYERLYGKGSYTLEDPYMQPNRNGVPPTANQVKKRKEDSQKAATGVSSTDASSGKKELEKAISEKKLYLTQAKRIQEGVRLSGVADPESELYDPEFDSLDDYNGTSPKSVHDSKDNIYEYVNNYDDFRSKYKSYHITSSSDNPFSDGVSSYEEKGYDFLNEQEIAIFNYYYAKDGKKAAKKYLDSIQDTLVYRKSNDKFKDFEGNTLSEILFAIPAGVDQFESGIKSLFNFNDDYIHQTATQVTSQMIREDLEDDGWKLPEFLGGSSLGQVAYDITNTTSNMLPSIIVGSATGNPIVGASLLGSSAAGNAYQEMLNYGYDKGQARMYSTLVGVSEAGLEYVLGGISALGGKATGNLATKILSKIDNAYARAAIRFGGSMLSEGFEEGLQEYLEPWFKSIAFNTDYEAANLDEILYSGLLGALSAFGLEGSHIISSELATYKKGKELKTDGEVDRLAELGKTFSADTVAYQIANKVNKDTGAYTIGRLFNEVGASLSESNIADITNSLVERGIDQSQASTIAKWMSKVVNGATLTKRQQAALENNPVLAEVLYGTIIQPNSTVMQRTQAVNKLYGVESSMGIGREVLEAQQTPEAITQKLAYKKALGEEIRRAANPRSGLSEAQIAEIDGIAAKARTTIPESNYQDVGQGSYKPSSAKIADTTDKVSDTGKTFVKSTGEEVSIKKIASIDAKNKTMKLELSNGTIVDSNDVSYGDENQALLFESVPLMGYDVKTANAIVQGYANSPTSVSDYLIGTNEAFNYGWGHISEKARGGTGYKKLTQSERTYAVKLGEDARAADDNARGVKVSQQQATATKKKAKGGYGAKLSVDNKSVTERVKKSVKALDSVAKALKLNIVIADLGGNSYGYYKRSTNELFVDVNAGGNGKHTLLFTASHELIHYVRNWSPDKFTVLADFLMEQYAAKGENIDALIRAEIDKAYKATRGKHEMTFDEAYEEVVAQAMQRFLTDSNFIERLTSLEKKDANLAKRLVAKLKEILNSIRAAYKGMDTNDRASQAVKEMGEAIDELYAKMEEGLIAASEASQSIGERNLEDFSEAKNTNGEDLFQYKAMEADEEAYRQMLKKHGIMSEQDINKLFSTIDKAMVIIKNNLEVLDYAWEADIDDRSFSPVKPNSDNLYKVSLDFSTLCRKRILQQVIQTQLQDALNKPLSREESIAIRDELMKIQEEGRQIEIACALCYVESARMKSPAQIKKFLKNREAVIKEFLASKSGGDIKQKIKQAEADARERLGVGNDSLKSMPKKAADEIRLAKREAKKAYTPTAEEQKLIDAASSMAVADFTSPEGLENLAKNYPVLFDAYTSYVRNATKSKGIEKDTWWRAGDSDSIGDTLIANMNKENGLRSQSWSDFQVIHLLDYIAATIELSTRNAKEQAYSKVPDYIDLMGNTGVMLNMSLIPTAQFNGKLEYDSVEGMAYTKALELRDKYHATAGTICIGISNEQIKMLLDDSTIDYVIPYHKSGMAAHIRKLMHIPTWSEYEKYQNETELSRDEALKQAKKYGVTLLSESDPNYHKHTAFSEWFDIEEARQIAKQENAFPTDANLQKKLGVMYGGYMAMQNAANNYLKLCAERGIAPKFSHENANFSEEANYWKLIIDRKMVDNVTGEIIEQQAIKPIFDEAEVLRILSDELKRYPDVKADQEYATRTVVEKFLSGKMNDRLDADTVAAIMQKPVDNITTTNIVASAEQNTRLTDADLDEYMKVGKTQHTRNKKRRMLESGKKPILTSSEEIVSFMADVIHGKASGEVRAFAKAGGRLASAVQQVDGKLEVFGDYLELNADDLRESYKVHSSPKEKGDIPLSDADFQRIPEYLDDFDGVLLTNYYNGKKEVHLYKETEDGYIRILAVSSSERGSLLVTKLIGVSKEKFQEKYAKKIERNTGSPRGQIEKSDASNPLTEARLTAGVLSDVIVSQKPNSVKTNQEISADTEDLKAQYADIDSDGNKLTEWQQEYFKNSKVRDEKGRLLAVYHGTKNAGFTVFSKSDQIGYFFARHLRTSRTYADNSKKIYAPDRNNAEAPSKNANYKVYLNLENPYIFDGKGANWNSLMSSGKEVAISVKMSKWNGYKDTGYGVIKFGYGGKTYKKVFHKLAEFKSFVSSHLNAEMVETLLYAMDCNMDESGNGKLEGALPWDFLKREKANAKTTRDVVREAHRKKRYDGVIFKNVVDAGNTSKIKADDLYVAFHSNQIKSVANKKPTYDPDIRYQYIDEDAIDSRTLLAKSLEGAAKTDLEKQKLKEYQSKIDLINSEEKKLRELREQIKEISFSKGTRDTKKLKSLQFEANQAANRINVYDKQLLRLEATQPIANVLAREKEMAKKRQKQKDMQLLADYKEKSKATVKELLQRNQESRKKAIEGRDKTLMRHKIKKVVNDLDQLLRKGSKERNVKLGLQPAVAAALKAINMDTVAADERVAKYDALIAKAKDPDVIESLTATRDRIQNQGDAMKEKLEALRDAYTEIEDMGNEVPEYYRAETDLIKKRIDSVIQKVGNTPLRNMSLEQLESVYELYSMVLATVRNANSVFVKGKLEDLQHNASATMEELSEIKKRSEERFNTSWADSFSWNEMIPVYAFKRMGSQTLEKFFWEAIRGQNTVAQDLEEANNFASATREKYGYKKWNFNKIHEFKLKDGRTFRVTLKHMMSIYAYSKRNQALDHMSKGGFFFNDKETFRKVGGVLNFIKKNEVGYCVDSEVLEAIKEAMTDMQKLYVNEMQEYLTKMGDKGNEVSRTVWGIDIFKEKVYFPLKSVKDFIFQANQTAQESSLKNDGMTKETKPGASNPIVLEAFDEVWANHVNRMSQYHGLVIPIDNLNKIHNYGTWAGTDSMSVSTMLGARFGEAVNDYLNQFIKDLNGASSTSGAANPFFGFVGKFKKTAVAASTSVMVQQPTAILRAYAVMNPKYFVGMPEAHFLSTKWNELKKYAPIAVIKEIGGFEMSSGRQATEWLNSDTKKGIDKVSSKIDDITMYGAALGDKFGWCTIWEAVKREIKATTNLKVGSKEFFDKAGERFTEVIVLTQVYDSTLSRSGYMRSKHDSVKMLTSFMGEPTVSLNMMFDATVQAKRKTIPKHKAVRVIGATYASIIAASVAASLIYGLRDDDEDESYLEKFAESLGGKLVGDLIPLNMLPGVRDIISIFDGWDVERTDMAIFKDIKDAFDGLDSKSKSMQRKIEDLAGAIASVFGLPLKNVLRTTREIYNAYKNLTDESLPTKKNVGEAFARGFNGEENAKGEEKTKGESIYDAIVSGDKAKSESYKKGYKTEESYEIAVRTALRENDPRIKEAAEAQISGDMHKRVEIARKIVAEGNFSVSIVNKAINSEITAIKKAERESKKTN